MSGFRPSDFHAARGVDDWRVIMGGAHAFYRTASLRESADFLAAIAAVPPVVAPITRMPDVDIRPAGVFLRLGSTRTRVDEHDVSTARAISAAARERGLTPDPARLQRLAIAVAHPGDVDLDPFWRAILGYEKVGDVDLQDPDDRLPDVWFLELEPGLPRRRRLHLDVGLPHDQAPARVAAALAAGGRLIDDSHAPAWWTLADAQGHYVDIATWQERDDEA
jgi:4a-hydroxytetrahydrobiopterin dehydratase